MLGPQIRVVLADDHPIVLDGLRTLLDATPRIAVVGAARSAAELQTLLAARPADVLVLDLGGMGETPLTLVHQIPREALINVVKHAQATQVELVVRHPSSPTDLLVVSIQDNGQGAGALVSRPGHWGLRSMDEQARAVGGQLSVQRVSVGGVRVTVEVPLARDELAGE